jgi:hypothetical protein
MGARSLSLALTRACLYGLARHSSLAREAARRLKGAVAVVLAPDARDSLEGINVLRVVAKQTAAPLERLASGQINGTKLASRTRGVARQWRRHRGTS